MTKEITKMGRPTKYKKEYCEMLIDHMAKGYGYQTFAKKANVNIDTLYEWEKKHQAFADAKKQAFAQNRYFFENVGILGMTGQLRRIKSETLDERGKVIHREYEPANFNATTWIFSMKNRFGWRDKQDITSDGGQMLPQIIVTLPDNGRKNK